MSPFADTTRVEHVIPSDHVLDLFAVPGDIRSLPGGSGNSVLAGDLVLSPGRDTRIATELSPRLARVAVHLDTRPRRHPRDVRIAMPIPARDGSWVVDGWAASRFEPGSTTCTDAGVVRAAGAMLHAQLASLMSSWPLAAEPPRHRWDRAERAAFAGAVSDLSEFDPAAADFTADLLARRTTEPLGPNQLVHGDLAGNVLLDAHGAPVVIDFAPYWRPVLWADAVCMLDLVMWFGADRSALLDWVSGAPRQAMLRAAVFRLLSDTDPDVGRFRETLAPLLCGALPR